MKVISASALIISALILVSCGGAHSPGADAVPSQFNAQTSKTVQDKSSDDSANEENDGEEENTSFEAIPASSISEGKSQFTSSNCAGCHEQDSSDETKFEVEDRFADVNNFEYPNSTYSDNSPSELAFYITEEMADYADFAGDGCNDTCAEDIANYLWSLRDDYQAALEASQTENSSDSANEETSNDISNNDEAITDSEEDSSVVIEEKQEIIVHAINIGGDNYTDVMGILYDADRNTNGGTLLTHENGINQTNDSGLYADHRYGEEIFIELPVDNGRYNVVLKMAENYWDDIDERVFDVIVENNTMASGIDLVELAGKENAYDIALEGIDVSDESLSITLVKDIDNAVISAILVTQKQ